MANKFTTDILSRIYTNKVFLKAYRPIYTRVRNVRSAVIVNFHQFYEQETGFIKKGPSVHTHVDDFEEMLTHLTRRFEPITLDVLVSHLQNGTSLDNDSFVITMDDGYENNLNLGQPVLMRHNVPATLYIATGFIGTGELLPMDRIDYALRKTNKKTLNWTFMQDEKLEIDTKEKRCAANIRIGNVIKELKQEDLDAAFNELYHVLKVEPEREHSCMLNWNQVKQLQDSGVDIESHGVSHRCMTRLDEETAINELYQSRYDIEKNTGHISNHFAFPNGMEKDFNEKLRGAAVKAGYHSVASVIRGLNTPGITNPYHMRRVGMFENPRRTMLYIEKLFYKLQHDNRRVT